MKVAICYWGIARSTDFIIDSIQTYILNPLKEANIEFTTFLHTFTLSREYNNGRSSETNITLNNELWKLLLPDVSIIEDQDEVDKQLDLSKYRTKGDPWKSQGKPYIPFNTLDNHIRALYSLHKVTSLWKSSDTKFDTIIYLRPDVRYTKPLLIEWLQKCKTEKNIYIPNFHLYNKWNDRFAVGCPEIMIHYGERFLHALEYSKNHMLHSEDFLSNHMKQFIKTPGYIHFPFRRVRAGGIVIDTRL